MSRLNINFVSLGCDKNLVDSEVMLGIINKEGFNIVPDPEDAEIIIVNTCGFIMDASDESIKTVLQMAEYKTDGTCKALIVTGCMVQRYREEIFRELPEVDAIVGVADYSSIGDVIRDVSTGCRNINRTSGQSEAINDEAYENRMLITSGHYAYLKIAEGCDNYCAYCTIPSIRGSYHSRSMESIQKEAEALAEKGVKEVILVAQDTSLYGFDIYGKPMLPKLLVRLAKIKGIEWIRLLYCYPDHISDELIECMANEPKICRYLDMPIQHGSDKVLKRMKRHNTTKQIKEIVDELRGRMPDISIRTTVMTGFPGETDEEFNELLLFIKEMKFDKLGAFTYSREEGTAAYDMPDQVEDRIKEERLDIIMNTQKKISSEINSKLIGQSLTAIVDGYLPERRMYCARSNRDCYDIDGVIYFESASEIITGDFVQLVIVGCDSYDLIGKLIQPE